MTEAIVEVRDYTIEPDKFEVYHAWATEKAAPWLRSNLNLAGFWMDCGLEPELRGSNPQPPANGQANVCWIIHWDSYEQRQAEFRKIMSHDEWKAIWAEHPCPDAYLQMNVRFMQAA